MEQQAGIREFLDMLKRLSDAFGVSGFEDHIREIVLDFLEPVADELWVDSMGNVYAVRKGGRGEPKIMLDAHMDEIGLMVRHIEKNGFIRFLPVGGWVDYVLPGQRVRILADDGSLVRGVVGVLPPHILQGEERRKSPSIEEMWIDIGASSREEVENLGIRIGSPIDIDRELIVLQGGKVTGKSLDDRAGVAIALEAFRNVEEHESTIVLTITVQEETGLKGVRPAAYTIEPDLAIELDVTSAADVPGVPEYKQVSKVGAGPIIKVADGRAASGLLPSRPLLKLLEEIASEEGIPYQRAVLPGGTTNATAISLTKKGVPSVVVAVPTRYLHSPVELMSLNDAINAARLVKAALKRVNREWYEKNLSWKRLKG
ncbi:MAG: M42 family metallopeptidase [Desulfurococcales archaeon]|nr:M42 family metallopeptidase [Desulfurococcales archaeon]